MTYDDYERFQHDMLARDADAAQDEAYEASACRKHERLPNDPMS
jgi:hypothetical protein